MSAIKAYLAALVFLLPIGACCALSARGADQVGLDYSDEKDGLGAVYIGCGRSAESCEAP